MDFGLDLTSIFKIENDGFIVIECSQLKTNKFIGNYTPKISNLSSSLGQVRQQQQCIIDNLGIASAKAQNLNQVITTFDRIIDTDNIIYMLTLDQQTVAGFIKVGKKKLFYYDQSGKITEMTPLSVLDFYVHSNVQRTGLGKKIFEKMLNSEKTQPNKLAYDRPSNKLIAFLKKHYQLNTYVKQNNNFVIFNDYFKTKTYELDLSQQMSKLSIQDNQTFQNKQQFDTRQISIPGKERILQDNKNQFNLTSQDFNQQTKLQKPLVTQSQRQLVIPPWATNDDQDTSNQFKRRK